MAPSEERERAKSESVASQVWLQSANRRSLYGNARTPDLSTRQCNRVPVLVHQSGHSTALWEQAGPGPMGGRADTRRETRGGRNNGPDQPSSSAGRRRPSAATGRPHGASEWTGAAKVAKRKEPDCAAGRCSGRSRVFTFVFEFLRSS